MNRRLGKIIKLAAPTVAITLLTACAPKPIVLTPGAAQIAIGYKPPQSRRCDYRGALVAHYGDGWIGQTMRTDSLRLRANVLLRNQAQRLGANYIYIQREYAKMIGAFNYQSATAITIEGQAFRCQPEHHVSHKKRRGRR